MILVARHFRVLLGDCESVREMVNKFFKQFYHLPIENHIYI